jgi:hypothetical protein
MLQDIKARLGGLALIALGLGLGWFFLLEPLQKASHGAHEVHYSLKAVFAVPACLIFGVAFMLLGKRLRYRDDAHKNFTAVGWILFALVALATAAGFWWFQQQFAALGYSDL